VGYNIKMNKISFLLLGVLFVLFGLDLYNHNYPLSIIWYILIIFLIKDILKYNKIKIFKEQEKVISPNRVWVAIIENTWLYTSNTLIGLIWKLISEWKHDKHLVG